MGLRKTKLRWSILAQSTHAYRNKIPVSQTMTEEQQLVFSIESMVRSKKVKSNTHFRDSNNDKYQFLLAQIKIFS